MPARMQRKILKTGASKAAALPPNWLRAFNLNVGDSVDVLYNSIVIIKPKGFKIDPGFLRKEFDLIMNLEKKTQRRKEIGQDERAEGKRQSSAE